jgi:hypothetical protein
MIKIAIPVYPIYSWADMKDFHAMSEDHPLEKA